MDLAPHIPGMLSAYAILLVAASSPGPAVALLLGIATRQGRGPALVASFGIASGNVVINLVTLVGVGILLAQAAGAMTFLRLFGAAYLLWLAYGALRKAAQPPEIAVVKTAPQPAFRLYLVGLLLQVTNPKAIVFWLAIASIGATLGGGAGVIAVFVLGAFLISFLCHGAWALLLSSGPVRSLYARGRRWVETALGAFFGFAAYKLVTSEG